MDAFLHEGKLDEPTYQEQLRRLRSETDEVQAQLQAATPEDLDLESTLDFARGVLSDPVGCWQRLAPEQRTRFQQAIYPSGLRYQNASFGTAETSWAFGYFREVPGAKEKLASPAGFEPYRD